MNSNYLLLGGLAGAIAMAWSYVRGFLSSIAHIAIESTTLNGDLSDAVEAYLKEHAPALVPAYAYAVIFAWGDRGKGKFRPTVNKYIATRALFYWAGRPIWLSGQPGRRTVATLRGLGSGSLLDRLTTAATAEVTELTHAYSNDYDRYSVIVVRGNSNAIYGDGQPHQGSSVTRTANNGPITAEPNAGIVGPHMGSYFPYGAWSVSHGRDEISRSVSKEALDRGFARTPQILSAVEDIRRWKLSEDWYRKRGIPWRRGWLLVGGPGTGKSSFVRYVASTLNMPVRVFDLTSMNNTEFGRLWTEFTASVPCIALFEDIDCVYHGRDLVDGKRGPSYDVFLNAIGGVEGLHGVCVVVTTNKPELLDPALCDADGGGRGMASRPGRIDHVLRLDGSASLQQRRHIAANILDTHPELQEEFVAQGRLDTPAQFVSRCQDAALKLYWSEPRATPPVDAEKRRALAVAGAK